MSDHIAVTEKEEFEAKQKEVEEVTKKGHQNVEVEEKKVLT